MACYCLTLLTFSTSALACKPSETVQRVSSNPLTLTVGDIDYIFLPNCLLNNIDSPEAFDQDVHNT